MFFMQIEVIQNFEEKNQFLSSLKNNKMLVIVSTIILGVTLTRPADKCASAHVRMCIISQAMLKLNKVR